MSTITFMLRLLSQTRINRGCGKEQAKAKARPAIGHEKMMSVERGLPSVEDGCSGGRASFEAGRSVLAPRVAHLILRRGLRPRFPVQ